MNTSELTIAFDRDLNEDERRRIVVALRASIGAALVGADPAFEWADLPAER